MKHILVTGGAGFIGSHTVLELLNSNYQVTVVDNLDNSSRESLKRVSLLTGRSVSLHTFDLRAKDKLEDLFSNNDFFAVIHFAGLKAVGESVEQPLKYYDNNLISTIILCETMDKFNVRRLVFSSSATVYGDPVKVPIKETAKIQPTNPYGQTKAMIEQILCDISNTNSGWQVSLLRYFNPIGAHKSGRIGEDPSGIPNNLLPYVAQVAVGKLKMLRVFGDDYSTPDGTGIRDYIHVVDLSRGHVAALEHLPKLNSCEVYNLGTGKGSSVLEVIHAFEKACGKKIPYQINSRRPGDISVCYADSSKAEKQLKWQTTKTLLEACEDTWRWQSQNPHGYKV